MISRQPCGAIDPLVRAITCSKSASDHTCHSVETIVVKGGSSENSRISTHDVRGEVIRALKRNGGRASSING
jgi:hypothetical protein